MGALRISSTDLASLEKACNDYFYTTTIKINPGTLEISNSKGILTNHIVKKKSGRYRLEEK